MQKTLDAITAKNQLASVQYRTVLNTFSTIQDIIDVSYKLNSNFASMPLNFRELFIK